MAEIAQSTVAAPAVKSPAPKSCSAFSLAHEDKRGERSLTCKRLPMHKGECRVTLHEAPKSAPKSAKRRVGKRSVKRVTRVDAFAKIATDLESGKITAGQALAKAAAYVTKSAAPKSAKVAAVVA